MSAIDRASALAAMLAVSTHAHAVDVSHEDIERIRRAQPVVTEEAIERARRTTPTVLDAATPSTPRIDALPQPRVAPGAAPTLDAIARGFEGTADTSALQNQQPRMLVFISLGMPEPTLQRLIDQATRTGATLLLRGLHEQSLTRTAVRMRELIGQRRVAVQIDPEAFDRYAIEQVPSFVLTQGTNTPCDGGRCPAPSDFIRAGGDVSLGHVLERFRRSPRFAAAATPLLKRLDPLERR